jgi:hypothetical protein
MQARAQKTTLYNKKLTVSRKTYTINAEYPQMEVPSDALMGVRGTLMDFNQPIEDIINFQTAKFVTSVTIDRVADSGLGMSSLTVMPDVTSDSKNVFSLKFEFFTELYHEAHPNSVFESYNFSYDQWQPFRLKDMFDTTSNYLKVISDYCRNDLMKQFKELGKDISGGIDKGTEPAEENFKTFNISGDRLLITFQYYQLGPRPFGAPVVSMPLKELKGFINPAGPLGYYIKK